MKLHTTNYYNAFIEIAEDSPTEVGKEPALRGGKKTVAGYQFDILKENPYQFTSDEILFKIHAIRKDFIESELEDERLKYFSKGQPCFRASPLGKKFGWGVHSNSEGKVAIYGRETEEYQKLIENEEIKKVKAMRSKRK